MSRRTLLGACVAAYVVLLVVAATVLPDEVPLHVGIDGTVDRTGSRVEALLLLGGLGLGTVALLAGGALAAPRLPLAWINVPHLAWWSATPQREARMRRMLADDLWLLACATTGLFALVLVAVVLLARGGDDVTGPLLLVAVVVWGLVVGVGGVLAARRRYRPDDQPDDRP